MDYPCVGSPFFGVESGLNKLKDVNEPEFVEAKSNQSPILLVNGPSDLGPPCVGLSSWDWDGSKKGKRAFLCFRDAEGGFGANVDGDGVVSPPRQVFSLPISLRLTIDEALLEEAVSYPCQTPLSTPLGFRAFSSSPSLLGGCDAGCLEVASSSSRQLVEASGKGSLVELGPLKMTLDDGSLLEVLILKGKEGIAREVKTSFDKGRDCALGKDDGTIEETGLFNKLATFCKFLGMPTKCFEEEISP